MKTKAPPVKVAKELTLEEKILQRFDKYVDTTSAVLEDYVADRDMIMELGTADVDFKEDLEELITDIEIQPGKIVEKLKDLTSEELSEIEDELIEFAKDELDLEDSFVSAGYAVIKIDNENARRKLEDFVKAEIWPNVNDEQFYNI